jgi:HSP20 family protein
MDRDPFREIQHEMNRLFDTFLGRPTAAAIGTGSPVWMPVVDVYETQNEFVLDFELPGVREKDISLSITGDLLTVTGERHVDQPRKDDHYLHMERGQGKFERSVRLPRPVQTERVTATYRDGVLDVRLPTAESTRPKAITIKAS